MPICNYIAMVKYKQNYTSGDIERCQIRCIMRIINYENKRRLSAYSNSTPQIHHSPLPKLIASGRCRRPRKRKNAQRADIRLWPFAPRARRSALRGINKNEFFLDITRVRDARDFIGLFGRTLCWLTLTKWKNVQKCP